MIKVLIVEDMTILRETLTNTLNNYDNIEVICSIDNASLADTMCETYKPDLVLMDICTLDGSSGIEATFEIKRKFPNIKVILMTGVPDITFIENSKVAGAEGFVYKNIGSNELINTILQVMNGYNIYPNNSYNNSQNDSNSCIKDFSLNELTKKELSILKLLCEAKSRKEICKIMKISDGHLRNSISNILDKTGFDNISRLSIYVVSHGYIHTN